MSYTFWAGSVKGLLKEVTVKADDYNKALIQVKKLIKRNLY